MILDVYCYVANDKAKWQPKRKGDYHQNDMFIDVISPCSLNCSLLQVDVGSWENALRKQLGHISLFTSRYWL